MLEAVDPLERPVFGLARLVDGAHDLVGSSHALYVAVGYLTAARAREHA